MMPPMNTSRTPPSPSPARLCTIPIVSPAGRPWRRLIYIHRPLAYISPRNSRKIATRREYRHATRNVNIRASSRRYRWQLFSPAVVLRQRTSIRGQRKEPVRAGSCNRYQAVHRGCRNWRTCANQSTTGTRLPTRNQALAASAVTFLLSDAPAPLHMRRVAATGATSAGSTAA